MDTHIHGTHTIFNIPFFMSTFWDQSFCESKPHKVRPWETVKHRKGKAEVLPPQHLCCTIEPGEPNHHMCTQRRQMEQQSGQGPLRVSVSIVCCCDAPGCTEQVHRVPAVAWGESKVLLCSELPLHKSKASTHPVLFTTRGMFRNLMSLKINIQRSWAQAGESD